MAVTEEQVPVKLDGSLDLQATIRMEANEQILILAKMDNSGVAGRKMASTRQTRPKSWTEDGLAYSDLHH